MHKGWYSRGYLPHFDQPEAIQTITFRLGDSLPPALQAELLLDAKTDMLPDPQKRASERRNNRKRIEETLDAGYGACCLKDDTIAHLVEDALFYHDADRYHLLAWVIMPNHVHALIEVIQGYSLQQIVHSWKSFTAHKINAMLNRTGKCWQEDYYDRFIRDEVHYKNVVNYIHLNPVKAGLVKHEEEWRHSSLYYFNKKRTVDKE